MLWPGGAVEPKTSDTPKPGEFRHHYQGPDREPSPARTTSELTGHG
jgi:hypothetical protein